MGNKDTTAAPPRRKKQILSLVCGLLGCLCFGAGDWLMLYGDPAHTGSLYWLTEGVAQMAPWRFTLAMLLAFPGIVLYGTALFSLETFIKTEKPRRIYRTLTVYSVTPWLCLHLFYILILFAYGWMKTNGYAQLANPLCEAVFAQFSWLPLVSEILMVPPYLYWFYLQISGKTALPKLLAVANVLVFYAALYGVKSLLPVSAFRLGFTNGLMSESMLLWFAVLLTWALCGTQELPQRETQEAQ